MELEKIIHFWVDLKHEENQKITESTDITIEDGYPESLKSVIAEYASKNEEANKSLEKSIKIAKELVIQKIIEKRDKMSFLGDISRDEIKEIVDITDRQLSDDIQNIWSYQDNDKQCFNKIRDIMEGCCY